MKLCVNCKFFENTENYNPGKEKEYICHNKNAIIHESMVGGNIVRKTAYIMQNDGPCFPQAVFFKKKGEE